MQEVTEIINQTETIQTCSAIPPNISRRNTPSLDEETALLALINRARALQGWKMQDAKTLEKRILLWWDTFHNYRIPLEHYRELFDIAFDICQQKLGLGEKIELNAPLLVSCWTRPGGLRSIVEQRRIKEGRTLSGNAISECPRCFGIGLENKFDADGNVIGVIPGKQCNHRPIEEGEPLYKKSART